MLSWLPNCGNQKTTQESTYRNENMSEINDIVELTEGMYLLLKTWNNWPTWTEIPQSIEKI